MVEPKKPPSRWQNLPKAQRRLIVWGGGVAVLLVVGGALLGNHEDKPASHAETKSPVTGDHEAASDLLTITRSEVGADWPLTVSRVSIECEGLSLVLVAKGRRYGLNGTAQDQLGLPAIDPIWKDEPGGYGLKPSIGPVMERAARWCGVDQ